jgi:hypothetical protein
MPGIMRGVLGASAFLPFKLCNTSLAVNGGSAHMPMTSIQPTQQGSKEGSPSHPRILPMQKILTTPHCFYSDRSCTIFVLVYVDDIVVASSSVKYTNALIHKLN